MRYASPDPATTVGWAGTVSRRPSTVTVALPSAMLSGTVSMKLARPMKSATKTLAGRA